MAGEEAHGMARVHDQGLVPLHEGEVVHGQQELYPIGEHLTIPSVGHQLVWKLQATFIKRWREERDGGWCGCGWMVWVWVDGVGVGGWCGWRCGAALDAGGIRERVWSCRYLGNLGVQVVHDHVHDCSRVLAFGGVQVDWVRPVGQYEHTCIKTVQ